MCAKSLVLLWSSCWIAVPFVILSMINIIHYCPRSDPRLVLSSMNEIWASKGSVTAEGLEEIRDMTLPSTVGQVVIWEVY